MMKWACAKTAEPSWLKKCGCSRWYNCWGWLMLPIVGEMDDGEQVLQLRNCRCGSTLGVVIRLSRKAG